MSHDPLNSLDLTVAAIEPQLVAIRRHLHAHPEPSGHERATSQFIADQVAAAGLRPRILREGLGVTVDLDVGRPVEDAPFIALRADIDALRIQDAKTTPYASQNAGLCHACGHDAHTTIVLGAALALSRWTPPTELDGVRLRLLFQPAEETAEGARWLVEQGVMEGVAVALASHVDPERPLGTAAIRSGALTAYCDDVVITVTGRGGHAARPHHTDDPIAAAAQLVVALHQYLPRSVDSRSPAVFTVGRLCGGTLPNVIPPQVEILGTLRTLEPDVRRRLKERIEEIVHGCKEASGTAMHLEFRSPIDGVWNDEGATQALSAAARSVLGDDKLQPIPHPSMGGEDFSAYLTRAPGAMIRLGCAPPGFAVPFLHAPDFDIDERVLAIGTRIQLRAALALGGRPGRVAVAGDTRQTP